LASATAATLAGLLAVAHLRDAARKALASIVARTRRARLRWSISTVC